VLNRHRLAREREVDRVGRHNVLGPFEGELALGNADEHDALAGLKARTVACSDVVLTLAALELDHRHQMLLGKCADRLDEAVVQGTKGGRRGDSIAEVLAGKRCLQQVEKAAATRSGDCQTPMSPSPRF